MTKLICVNSKGPMGSALLAGLIEKLGAVNVPLRQYGLSEYLLGEYELNSGVMQDRVAHWVHRYGQSIRLGGVNVLDRDSQQPTAFCDPDRVSKDLEDIRRTRYRSLDQLYRACMAVFCKSILYKKVNPATGVFIDYPIDFGEHEGRARELYDAYMETFDDVRMIHLHRNFEGWINAMAIQKFAQPGLKERFNFRLKSLVRHYYKYEQAVAGLPGLHLDFQELFSTPIEDLAERIGKAVDMPYDQCDWRNAHYDLYGKLVHFDQAFTPIDDGQSYLNGFSRRYFARYASHPDQVGLKEKLFARFLYVWCYSNFRLRRI